MMIGFVSSSFAATAVSTPVSEPVYSVQKSDKPDAIIVITDVEGLL